MLRSVRWAVMHYVTITAVLGVQQKNARLVRAKCTSSPPSAFP
jgi:hypothetical protein